MSLPKIASRDEWLAARKQLLAREKELTQLRDAQSIERRKLPMVEVEQDYEFEGPKGKPRLIDLFEGPRLMFTTSCSTPSGKKREALRAPTRCRPGSSSTSTRDTVRMVSQAPLAKLERWKATQGWDVPWASTARPTTTSASRSARPTLTIQLPHARRVRRSESMNCQQPYDIQPQLLPAGRRAGVPHVFASRPGPRMHGWLVLLPRPHRARPPRGLGGAQRPIGVGAGEHPRFRVVRLPGHQSSSGGTAMA